MCLFWNVIGEWIGFSEIWIRYNVTNLQEVHVILLHDHSKGHLLFLHLLHNLFVFVSCVIHTVGFIYLQWASSECSNCRVSVNVVVQVPGMGTVSKPSNESGVFSNCLTSPLCNQLQPSCWHPFVAHLLPMLKVMNKYLFRLLHRSSPWMHDDMRY